MENGNLAEMHNISVYSCFPHIHDNFHEAFGRLFSTGKTRGGVISGYMQQQAAKKTRTERGVMEKAASGDLGASKGGSASAGGNEADLPARALQAVLLALPLPDLLRLDVAFSSSDSSNAQLQAAYRHGGGLRSVAVDSHRYSHGSQLLWLAQRGVDATIAHFEMPLAERCEATRKRMSLWFPAGGRHTGSGQPAPVRSWPSFHWLLCYGNSRDPADREAALLLAARGGAAVVEAADSAGWTALHLACDTGDVAAVTALLSNRTPPQLEARSNTGQTPLCRALYWGCATCVRLLLARGADANAAEADGSTLLARAVAKAGLGIGAHSGDAVGEGLALQLVALLLEHGASPLAADISGATPAQLADRRGYPSVAAALRAAVEGDASPAAAGAAGAGLESLSLLALAALSME